MESNPELTNELMTDNIKAYVDLLKEDQIDKPILTENGKLVLEYMQSCGSPMMKAKDIAEGLFISSRTVSGSMRKLVSDGFCDKVGKDPVVSALTEKGKNFIIENVIEGENE
jgi:Mn-dependent DtxR family transcriptional regulator